MRKLASAAVVLAVLTAVVFATPPDGEIKPPAKELPNWRELKPRPDFLAKRFNPRDQNQYEFNAGDLLTEFAREGAVQISFDAGDIANIPKLTVTGIRTVNEGRLFDLCQTALALNNLTLIGNGERTFRVIGAGRVLESAPAVDPAKVGELAPREWATLTLRLNGKSAKKLISLVRPFMTLNGGAALASEDGTALILVDTATNLPRLLEIVRASDPETTYKPPVAYQRRSSTDLGALASTLSKFMVRYARARSLDETELALTWDSSAQLIVGNVPAEMAPFMDAAVDAADAAAKQRADAKEADDRSFVTFDVVATEHRNITAMESGLRALFGPEANQGDARFVIKDVDAGTMVVRCRNWLEQGVRDAVKSLGSK
ncbi:MAG: hypothetical protein IT462_00415 [Planctomycetes bacterium]|nr:hypothetical protein [Planctomycetota bacterium]